MTTDIVQQKTKEFYDSVVAPCTLNHLSTCDCCDEEIAEKTRELQRDIIKELQAENIDTDSQVAKERFSSARRRARALVAAKNAEEGIRCSKEKQMVQDTLELFASKYPIEDARVILTTRSVISELLSQRRFLQHTANEGSVLAIESERGSSYIVNPSESQKLQYDKAIIESIEKLDKMMDGVKISVSGEFTIRDALDKIKSADATIIDVEYKET